MPAPYPSSHLVAFSILSGILIGFVTCVATGRLCRLQGDDSRSIVRTESSSRVSVSQVSTVDDFKKLFDGSAAVFLADWSGGKKRAVVSEVWKGPASMAGRTSHIPLDRLAPRGTQPQRAIIMLYLSWPDEPVTLVHYLDGNVLLQNRSISIPTIREFLTRESTTSDMTHIGLPPLTAPIPTP